MAETSRQQKQFKVLFTINIYKKITSPVKQNKMKRQAILFA